MNNLQIITQIDSCYESDPGAFVPVIGRWDEINGFGVECHQIMEFEIHEIPGQPPAIWPGVWFAPYGGVYFNPVNLQILGEAD